MKRLHLFEIEDLSWCPKIIRESVTDMLVSVNKAFKLFDPAYQKIAETLKYTQTYEIVDCCSGSGGPITQLREYLDANQLESVPITLTDKYPNIKQFEQLENQYQGRLKGYKEAVDASHMPISLSGLRCFFSSFHHFPPDLASRILQDAVNSNMPIAIFESTSRHIIHFIRALLSPIIMWILVPFAKRLNWQKFIITYILPITPFVFMWDYFISNLRTYSVRELKELTYGLEAKNYQWEIGHLPSNNAPYLIGYPLNKT